MTTRRTSAPQLSRRQATAGLFTLAGVLLYARGSEELGGSDEAEPEEEGSAGEIFTNHPEYKPYGLPDTSNASDNVVGNANLASYVAVTSQLDDGALMAAKQIVVDL